MDKKLSDTRSITNFKRTHALRKAPAEQRVFLGIEAQCQIVLESPNTAIEFILPPDSAYLKVGRAPDEAGSEQILDLTPYNAHNAGVSRTHARFERSGVRIFVRDLNSSNGTWINGNRLVPDHVHEIFDGDRIEFGRMSAQFHIKP